VSFLSVHQDRPGSRTLLRNLIFGIFIAFILAFIVLTFTRFGPCTSESPNPEDWRLGRVALLPCKSSKGSRVEPWILDLVNERLEKAVRIQARAGLEPIGRAEIEKVLASMKDRKTGKSGPAEVGRKLAVPWVVTCDLGARGTNLVAVLSIVSSDQARIVDGDTFTGDMADTKGMAQNMALSLASMLSRVSSTREPLFEARILASDKDAARAFARAQDLYNKSKGFQKSNIDMISGLLEKSLSLDPELAPARALEIMAHTWKYLHMGRIQDLNKALKEAQSLANKEKTAWPELKLCELNDLAGDTLKAIKHCESASRIDPSRTPYLALAKLYIEANRTRDSAKLMEKAIEEHPGVSWLYFAAARFSVEIGRLDQAMELCITALQKEGKQPRLDESMQWPKPSGIHALLARIYYLKKDYKKSIPQAEKELSPGLSRLQPQAGLEAALVLRLCKTKLHLTEKDIERTRQIEEKAKAGLLSALPGAVGYKEAARIYLGLDNQAALDLAKKGLESSPSAPGLLKIAALASAGLGRLAQAKELGKKAIEYRKKKCLPCAEAFRQAIGKAIGKALSND